MHCDERYITR